MTFKIIIHLINFCIARLNAFSISKDKAVEDSETAIESLNEDIRREEQTITIAMVEKTKADELRKKLEGLM